MPLPRLKIRCRPPSARLEREDVGVGQVVNVYLVADAVPDRRRLVRTVELDERDGPLRGARIVWDQERLGIVVLSEPSACPRDVEVAQAHRAHPVRSEEVPDQPVDCPLRSAVRIGRNCPRGLGDRDLVRRAIHIRRRGEPEPRAVRNTARGACPARGPAAARAKCGRGVESRSIAASSVSVSTRPASTSSAPSGTAARCPRLRSPSTRTSSQSASR